MNRIPQFPKTRPGLNRALVRLLILVATLGVAGKCGAQQPPAKAAPAAATTPAPAEPDPQVVKLAAKPPSPLEGTDWKPLFDGKTLKGWAETSFAGHAPVRCESGVIVFDLGDPLTGINWTNEVVKMNYEIALETAKLQGGDFFCGLTFPVGDTWASLILGGWGGGVVGLSSIDGQDASENETSQFLKLDAGRWYRVRVRVTPKKIEAWLDEKKIVDVVTMDRKISLRFGEIELSKPLGIASYQTAAVLRDLRLRKLEQ